MQFHGSGVTGASCGSMEAEDRDLKDARVAVLVADGFEEIELTGPARALMDAGARVEIIAPDASPIQGLRGYRRSIELEPDRPIAFARFSDYQGLVLPGGVFSVDELRANPLVLQFVRKFQATWRPMGAIGHAAWILVSAGLARGRTLTGVYSLESDVNNAGGYFVDTEAAMDYNWVTSRGPYDLPVFNRNFLSLLRSWRRGQRHEEEPLISDESREMISKARIS